MEQSMARLISLEEFIARAKSLGVDFGNGDPKNRIRYLVKIGLLPHVQRKSFNGSYPTGAYPEYVLGILLEIDKKLKQGKTIQDIKREMKMGLGNRLFQEDAAGFLVQERPVEFPKKDILYQKLPYENFYSKEEKEDIHLEEYFNQEPFEEKKQDQEKGLLKTRTGFNILFQKEILLFMFTLILTGAAIFSSFFDKKVNLSKLNFFKNLFDQKIFSYFSASILKFAQAPSQTEQPFLERPAQRVLDLQIEPYLTINSETDISGPLTVRDTITIPDIVIKKGDFKGHFVVDDLTSDREYVFPNTSGTICLSTGNCVGLGERGVSGILGQGSLNRLAKFFSSGRIENSSINDLYSGGISITIDSSGRVGIGRTNPQYTLHVQGRIQATGDICTDLIGGRCLSTLPLGGAPSVVQSQTVSGVGGSGSAGFIPLWASASSLGNSVIFESGGKIGIGTTAPFYLLTVAGNSFFTGSLKISTTTLGQLVLEYDTNNYLKFEIDSNKSKITSSKTMIIDSLTGEIKLGDNVNSFNAFGATVQAATFISTTTDSTVRKSGERVLRSSLPIFLFSVPSQTSSTTLVAVSKEMSTSTLAAVLPQQLPGSTRELAFLINFADNISASATSSWMVDLVSGTDIEFSFPGQNMSDLDKGVAHLSNFISSPESNWQLKVKSPSTSNSIRIFNILLLVYDKIN